MARMAFGLAVSLAAACVSTCAMAGVLDVFGRSWAARPEGLPPLQRYLAPEFPPALAERSIFNGQAVVAFTADAEGRIEDAYALEASQVEFAEAALEALQHWQLEARDDGSRASRREVIRFAFSREDAVRTLNQVEAAHRLFPERPTSTLPRVVTVQDLAAPPRRVAGDKPVVPAETGGSGQAVVSFIVDPDGRVRVPHVQSATDLRFGDAALEAVRRWRYEPMKLEGAPVAVSVAQSFRYGAAAR